MSSCYRCAMQACAKSCDRFDACYSVVDAITLAVVWLSVPAWHVSIMIYPLHAVVMHAAYYLSWRISAIHWCCILCMLSMMPGMPSLMHLHAIGRLSIFMLMICDACLFYGLTMHTVHAIDLWYMLSIDYACYRSVIHAHAWSHFHRSAWSSLSVWLPRLFDSPCPWLGGRLTFSVFLTHLPMSLTGLLDLLCLPYHFVCLTHFVYLTITAYLLLVYLTHLVCLIRSSVDLLYLLSSVLSCYLSMMHAMYTINNACHLWCIAYVLSS